MMKLRLIIITLLLTLFVVPMATLASDISNALYFGVINVSNNSTATTNVATTANISTANLINGGYLNSTATNAVIRNSSGADMPFMPAVNATSPWVMWVSSIGADSILSYILYTANSTGGEIRYFPDTGGMTTVDSANLELGDNFTIEQKGLLNSDTGVAKRLVYKEGAFITYVSAATEITSELNTFSDNFTADGWTDVGTPKIQVNVGETRIDYEAERSADDERCYFDLTSLNDTYWSLKFTWNPASTAGANPIVGFGISDTLENIKNATGDAIYMEDTSSGVLILSIDGGAQAASSGITISDGTTYYVSLTRTSATNVDLSIFSDSDRSTHISGSPVSLTIPSTITGLRYIQVSNLNDNSGAAIEAIGSLTDMFLGDIRVTATGVSSGEHTITTTGGFHEATGDVLHFDGTANSYVNGDAIYNGATKLWFSFWFKLDSDYDSSDTSHNYFFAKNLDGSNFTNIRLDSSNGKMSFFLKTLGSNRFTILSAETSWSADTWNHVIASISSANGARLRINNGTAQTNANTNAMVNGGDFFIGNETGGVAGNIGYITNFVVGTDDLTANEETDLYNGILPSDETDLWYFDEGTGTNIISYGSSSNNGTAGSATSWGSTLRQVYFDIAIDGTINDSHARFISVPDNSANWTFLENDVMPYMESHDITIGGILQQDIAWEYSTTFTDQSGNSHDATPTFRTTSSDADVSAVMVSFQPIAEAKAPDFVLGEAPAFIDSDALTGNITGTFGTTPGASTSTFPLAGVITAVADATSTPQQIPLLIIATFITLAISLSVSATMRKYGSGSLIAKIIVIAGIMGIFIALANFGIDFWMLVIFLVIAIAIAFASRQLGWT